MPFTDRSGDRLRDWLGVTTDQFYDRSIFAIVPMAFCFPGYNATGADLPPPPLCAGTLRDRVMDALPNIELLLLVGGAAMNWHLGKGKSVTERVSAWREGAPDVYPLPHPSWRNTSWLARNHWFADELLPDLKRSVACTMASRS